MKLWQASRRRCSLFVGDSPWNGVTPPTANIFEPWPFLGSGLRFGNRGARKCSWLILLNRALKLWFFSVFYSTTCAPPEDDRYVFTIDGTDNHLPNNSFDYGMFDIKRWKMDIIIYFKNNSRWQKREMTTGVVQNAMQLFKIPSKSRFYKI